MLLKLWPTSILASNFNNCPLCVLFFTNLIKLLKGRGGYACLYYGGLKEDDYGRIHPCIYEKRMDKFTDSGCNMKER